MYNHHAHCSAFITYWNPNPDICCLYLKRKKYLFSSCDVPSSVHRNKMINPHFGTDVDFYEAFRPFEITFYMFRSIFEQASLGFSSFFMSKHNF